MNGFDFDKIIERRGTACIKYDAAERCGYPADVLPLWVADMDFPTAPAVIEALKERCGHGIFGYTNACEEYYAAVYGWMKQEYGWTPAERSVVTTPGVVFAINLAIRAFTASGDAVLIQPPVYYPFANSIEQNGRRVVTNPLVLNDSTGRYEIDFIHLEQTIRNEKVRLMLFCNPHNPGGRVWTQGELLHLGEICQRHDVLIVSDEIHADFIRPGRKHTVLASLSERLAQRTITCTSPSKSFNLAGLQLSNIFIENPSLRRRFRAARCSTGYDEPNLLGLTACIAAYTEGRPWLDAVRSYIWDNLERTRTFLARELPKVKIIEPDGTYLLWLDFRAYGLCDKELDKIIVNEAGLWLDSGAIFGPEGDGFQRINLACPWATLEEALKRLAKTFAAR